MTGKRSPQELTRAQRYKSLWHEREALNELQVLTTFTQVVVSPVPAVPTGCNHSMLLVPVWATEVAMHMARPFKDWLGDSGPAVSFLWRPSGKDYHRERFLLWFLILEEEHRGCSEGTNLLSSLPCTCLKPFLIL